MKTVTVSCLEVVIPEKLRDEMSNCEFCRAAHLCLADCCTEHYEKIKAFAQHEETSGEFVLLKDDIRALTSVIRKIIAQNERNGQA